MKTFRIGMFLTAVAMAVAVAGFGVAQAGGSQSDSPMKKHQEQKAGGASSMEGAGPVETGKVPELTDAEFWKIAEAEREKYKGMKDIDGH